MCELAIRYCSRPEPQLFAIRILGSESNPWAEKLESIQSNLQVGRFQTPLHRFILDCGSQCAMGQMSASLREFPASPFDDDLAKMDAASLVAEGLGQPIEGEVLSRK